MSFKLAFKKELFQRESQLFLDKVTKALQSKNLAKDIGDTYITDLKFQVRRGQSLSNNKKLKPLSESWIKKRRRIIANSGKPAFVSARKSNLSLSGQFLDSLKSRSANLSKGLEVTFRFEGAHEPYKMKPLKSWKVRNAFGSGKNKTFKRRKEMPSELQVGRRISNENLYTYLKRDRPFIGIRPQVQKRLTQLVVEEVRRSIKSVVTSRV